MGESIVGKNQLQEKIFYKGAVFRVNKDIISGQTEFYGIVRPNFVLLKKNTKGTEPWFNSKLGYQYAEDQGAVQEGRVKIHKSIQNVAKNGKLMVIEWNEPIKIDKDNVWFIAMVSILSTVIFCCMCVCCIGIGGLIGYGVANVDGSK